jgi:hypothetical protein
VPRLPVVPSNRHPNLHAGIAKSFRDPPRLLPDLDSSSHDAARYMFHHVSFMLDRIIRAPVYGRF